jgi:tight adherence protein C
MGTATWLRLGCLISFGAFTALLGFALSSVSAAKRPLLGYRGNQRQKALRSLPFRLLEPVLRYVAGLWSTFWSLRRLRELDRRLVALQSRHLQRAGDYLGLDAHEYSALCVLSAAIFGVVGYLLSEFAEQGYLYTVPGLAFGAALPYVQVEGELRRRLRAVRRSLPAAIDLAALCVSAGLDFPSALRAVVANADENDVLKTEFGRILDGLDIGHTRREALRGFERRVPLDAVHELVRALIQAEEKGTPIAEALAVQARMGRMQRSIAAEEAAARAGVLLILPMMLLLGCILLLLLGPLIVTGGVR